MSDLLTELGLKYGTDKATHHQFTPFYNKYFESIRFDVKNVMEIGVLNNASLKMWEEYFPNATIVGVDNQDKSHYQDGRIKIHLADQSSREQLLEVVKQYDYFDIIIDDGSHLIPHQYITLATLIPYVKSGGYYICEDLHTSYFPKWSDWTDLEVEVTMLESIKSLKKWAEEVDDHKFIHQYLSEKEVENIRCVTNRVNIFDRTGEYDSITAIIETV